MGKKSSPPPPDYTGAAEKQAQASQENTTSQTYANRADQYDPWGSSTWSQSQVVDPSTGQNVTKWTQNTSLTPELQSALDAQMGVQNARSQQAQDLIGRMQSEFGQTMDWSGLPAWQSGPQAGQLDAMTSGFGFGPRQQRIDTSRQQVPGLQTGLDFSGAQGVQGADQNRQKAEDAIYQSATSRLDPRFNQQQRAMETQLANQGITQGSDAYRQAMENFGQTKNDAYQQAQMGAITGAGAEAQRNQAMDLGLRQQQVGEIGSQGQFGNTALGQMFGFGNTARGQQLSAQDQAFNQGLAGSTYGLAQQQQAFGQNQQAGAQNFQQQMAASQFQNQMRQQQLQEAMAQRGFSLNEMNALLSGQQVQSPQFAGYGQAGIAQTPDYLGALQGQYGAQVDASNASNAQAAGNAQAGIGAAAMIAVMI